MITDPSLEQDIEYSTEDQPSIRMVGTETIREIIKEGADSILDQEYMPVYSALAGHIMGEFRVNKDAKRNSGIEGEITESLAQYNGKYSVEDISRIALEKGSSLFMNITATKCRAAASWIRDILLAVNSKSWKIRPTPKASLPPEVIKNIEDSIEKEFTEFLEGEKDEEAKAQQPPQPQAPQPNQPPQAPPKAADATQKVTEAQETIQKVNQDRRDIKEAIYDEIQKEATYNMNVMERQIEDQLLEGDWNEVFSTFIDDFVVFPAAFIKGPIVTKAKKVVWQNGEPTTYTDFVFKNRRVSPYDIYPAPEARNLNEGSLCEHLRLTRAEVDSLKGIPGYKRDKIKEVLSDSSMGVPASWIDTGIESEKADLENRGTDHEANRNVIHGLHFFGSISTEILKMWGMDEECIASSEDTKEWEVEAILLNNTVVKCSVNDDPLCRRPYYCASFQSAPGSLWGRSLPNLMRDIQRMCNATARALANNMALASGPQVEVYIDRLADDGDISSLSPFHIWQLTSDPSGGGGRAINFFQPSSNAQELLAVYENFESRADDATGIPKYAYGNEKVGGAAETASGLAMLLEAASKQVKDSIRNIDAGVIVPRIEYQFYFNLIKNPDPTFNGDVQVEALGSAALTVRGTEQIKRNEFLKITANAIDQKIMGVEGRASIIREMSEELGFIDPIVPSRLDMKKTIKEEKEAAGKQQQAEQQSKEQEHAARLEGARLQIDGQKDMNKISQEVKLMAENNKMERHNIDSQLKAQEIESFKEGNMYRSMTTATNAERTDATKKELANKEMAISLSQGSGQ